MSGHKIVSNGTNVFYLNTMKNFILRLDCKPSVEAEEFPDFDKECKWTELKQKLKFPRVAAVAMMIPDDQATCSKETNN